MTRYEGATVNQVNAALQRLCGKYCHSCKRTKPIAMYDMSKGRNVLKCIPCSAKHSKPKLDVL